MDAQLAKDLIDRMEVHTSLLGHFWPKQTARILFEVIHGWRADIGQKVVHDILQEDPPVAITEARLRARYAEKMDAARYKPSSGDTGARRLVDLTEAEQRKEWQSFFEGFVEGRGGKELTPEDGHMWRAYQKFQRSGPPAAGRESAAIVAPAVRLPYQDEDPFAEDEAV